MCRINLPRSFSPTLTPNPITSRFYVLHTTVSLLMTAQTLSQHSVFSASYHKGLNVEYEASSTVLSIKTCSIHSVFFLPFQILLSIHEIILHTPEFLPQRVKVIAPGRPSQMLRNIQEFSILEVSGIRAYEEMPKMAFKKNSRF